MTRKSDKEERKYSILSPNQHTFLSELHRRPMSLQELQKRVQTTVRGCYRRELFTISRGLVEITDEGTRILKLQTHADILRSRAQATAPFAAIIRDLVQHQGRKLAVVRGRKVA